MTKFLLIRHGAHDLLGRVLAGRMAGVSLNELGRQQASALPERLSGLPVHAIYSSPMDRTQETAAPLARALGLTVQTDPAFHEIDFGAWTGKSFQELQPDPEWQLWNTRRSAACPPGGETMQAVQARFVAGLRTIAADRDGQTVVIVSHGDPIKSTLLGQLGSTVDSMPQLEISPASISIVQMEPDFSQVDLINALGNVASFYN